LPHFGKDRHCPAVGVDLDEVDQRGAGRGHEAFDGHDDPVVRHVGRRIAGPDRAEIGR
jgi:hypothetical protein